MRSPIANQPHPKTPVTSTTKSAIFNFLAATAPTAVIAPSGINQQPKTGKAPSGLVSTLEAPKREENAQAKLERTPHAQQGGCDRIAGLNAHLPGTNSAKPPNMAPDGVRYSGIFEVLYKWARCADTTNVALAKP